MSQRKDEMDELFAFLRAPDLSPRQLLNHYVNYHGALALGHRQLFVKKVSKLISDRNGIPANLKLHHVVDRDGALVDELLMSVQPQLLKSFYTQAGDDDFVWIELLSESPNQWIDSEILPLPARRRLGRERRAAFCALKSEKRSLFVSPFGFQYFDALGNKYWPSASSRAFSRSIEFYPQIDIDQPVVVVQDQFDDGNFSHFLFDVVPRILYSMEILRESRRNVVFVVGGESNLYQRFWISRLCEMLDLDENQFHFAKRREVWHLKNSIYFFSDQKLSILHPLHMAHPQTVRIVRDLARSLPDTGVTMRQIYISRKDANTRRITNEAELMAGLAKLGFRELELSKLDIPEQISVLTNCQHVVAPHGMGLTNFLFNRRVSSLTEIFGPANGTDAYAFVAKSIGARYAWCVGDAVAQTHADFHVSAEDVIETVLSSIRGAGA